MRTATSLPSMTIAIVCFSFSNTSRFSFAQLIFKFFEFLSAFTVLCKRVAWVTRVFINQKLILKLLLTVVDSNSIDLNLFFSLRAAFTTSSLASYHMAT